jgi:hypothetical protein
MSKTVVYKNDRILSSEVLMPLIHGLKLASNLSRSTGFNR